MRWHELKEDPHFVLVGVYTQHYNRTCLERACQKELLQKNASGYWSKGISACSHAEWAETRVVAERKAIRWRKEPHVETIEILEARQV